MILNIFIIILLFIISLFYLKKCIQYKKTIKLLKSKIEHNEFIITSQNVDCDKGIL